MTAGAWNNRIPDERTLEVQRADGIAALLREPTVALAAAAAQLDERLLQDWLETAAFREAYWAARQDAAAHQAAEGVARLREITVTAAETLIRNLNCGIPEVEVKAAQAILHVAVEGSGTL